MIAVEGYEVGQSLPTSGQARVYRGRRVVDGAAVILKLPSLVDGSGKARENLLHEHELLARLDIRGVPRALELTSCQGQPVLVIEDTGTQPLREICRRGPMPVAPFLDVAITVSEILAQLHEAGVIHKNINPSNVMFDPATGKVDLIDFGFASRLPREVTSYRSPNLLEGTLPYLAPEQTGRMNRAVDYRSDFYALGMTFYEMLTGRVAFASNDPLELCHCHIAKMPPPPSIVIATIPDAVSQIVMKLVAKMAEDRYQSAYGLLADLRECQRRLATGEGWAGFVVGSRDVSRVLSIPQKLYGREDEVAGLLSSFERVCAGGMELVTVSGYSGIGKSSLVHEVHRPIVRSGGYFIQGKFDQYRRDVPYEAFVEALRQLCRDLLLEGDEQFPIWKQRFEETLGSNAAVLAELIPEIELFTGSLPPPHELGAADAQRRLIAAFQQLLSMFDGLRRPLVVFIDDLQWADPASLMLLRALGTVGDNRHLMLIGAYRDNEVDATHPLQLTLNAINEADAVQLRAFAVLPLGLPHIEQLVLDTFRAPPASARQLAEILESKTSGNPFFLAQMLVSLHHQGLIEFDPRAGAWHWDTARIAGTAITDNVVELMLGQIQRLTPSAQRLLQRAACIGNRFDLAILARIDDQAPETASETLWEALFAGFVVPEDRHRFACYHFSHDRVQQAVYSMLPEGERAAIHLRIGRMILGDRSPSELGAESFDVLSHFSAGAALIDSPAERAVVARLALVAGTRARASHAYATAVHLLGFGLSMQPTDAWRDDYEQTLALAMELAQAEYQSGDFARAEQRFREIIATARALPERANAYHSLLLLHQNAGRFAEAVGCGMECLALFDINISPATSFEDALAMMHAVVKALGERSIAELADAPALTDPAQLALSRVLVVLHSISYFIGPAMYTAVSSRAAMVFVEHGNTPAAAAAYTYFASTLCIWGDYEHGFAFADLGLTLRDRKQVEMPAHITFMQGAWLMRWRQHLKATTETLRVAIQECVEAGDLGTAAFSCGLMTADLFVRGTNLAALHQEALRWAAFCYKVKSDDLGDAVVAVDRACLALMGATNDPSTYNDGDGFDEQAFDARINQRAPAVLVWWYCYRAFVHYVLGDLAAAQAAADKTAPLLWAIFGQIRVPEHKFHRSLIDLARWPELTADGQRQAHEHAATTLTELQHLAQRAPMTFHPRALLLAAELARVDGRASEAADLYDDAIASAIEHDYIQVAAVSCECAMRHALASNKRSRARGYLLDALQHYGTWGAARKVEQLTEQHRMWLPSHSTRTATTPRMTTNAARSSQTMLGGGLDLRTATKASQTISGEIQLDRLLEKLTHILIEAAGAERGVIVLKSEERLLVEASFTAAGEVRVLEGAEVASYPGVSAGVIGYVARTGEQVVLDCAARSSFALDPHLASGAVKSVLCVPITNQNRLVGVMYLENNLVEACFTVDRLEVLRILMTQIAISIDNAKLYAGLEAKVRERTAALSARERSLRLILDSTGDGLLSFDRNGKIYGEISAAVTSWFGEVTRGSMIWQVLGRMIRRSAGRWSSGSRSCTMRCSRSIRW